MIFGLTKGHKEARCFELIGYPVGWGTPGRGRGRGWTNRGGRPVGGGQRGEAVNSVTTNAVAAPDASTNASPVPGFTAKQVQRILSLIDDQKVGYEKLAGNIEWLYDTGASCHMTGVFEVLKNVKKINTIIMVLPDGSKAKANKVGCVQLGPNIFLKEVLFVPKLKCNLISIWQLNKDSNYIMTFTDNFYVTQDHISRNLIGVGRVKGEAFLHKWVHIKRGTDTMQAFDRNRC